MGYSARYHATSLIAVFIALAIGILIGAALGGDVVDRTRKDLENSLTGNLEDARSRADQLGGELGLANEFGEHVYPALVDGRLQGRRVAVVAMGGLPPDVFGSIEDALGPTGARLVGVGVVREPVDLQGLAGDLSKTRFADMARNTDTQTAFGVGVGRQLAIGGTMVDAIRGQLFSRASGNFGALDGVIVVRSQPQDMGPAQRTAAGRLEAALASGITGTRTATVGVENSDTDDSSISFFQGNDLSSVDDIDLVAGRLAMVLALRGAEGSFGIKPGADRLLPDLLLPNRP
jgi:hypothetical protein